MLPYARTARFAAVTLLAGLLAACSASSAPETVSATAAVPSAGPEQLKGLVTTPTGLKHVDIVVGTGAWPKTGQTCVMHYTGWLYNAGVKGAQFDSSRDRGQPFEFKIGTRQVIPGWDEGVLTMKAGGKRTLIIPPHLGYGPSGSGSIPGNSTLIFEVELIAVKG